MYFEAQLSASVRIITAVVFLFFLGVLLQIIRLIIGQGVGAYLVFWGVAIVVICLLIWVSRYRILGYHVNDGRLEMRSWGRDYPYIELQYLERAELVKIPFYKVVRLWGNGGVWGFYGEFKRIGGPNFTAYVTDTRNCVMLHMKGGERIVISPYDREAFVAALAALRPNLLIKAKE